MRLLSSLTNRIFLAAAALAVLTITIAIFLVNAAVTRQAEEALNGSQQDASTLMEQYRGALFEHFIREARLVADLPKLKAAVFEDHPPTVQPIAEDYQRQIGSDLFLVTNARGHLLAQVGAANEDDPDLATRPAVRSALEGHAATSFWARADEILQVVAVPVWIDPTLPEMLGTLTVGFSLNRQMAEQFKRLTNTEVAFAMAGEIEASTLDDQHRRTLASLLDASGVTTVSLGGEEYVAIVQPLASSPPSVLLDSDAPQQSPPRGASAGPLAVILRSRTAALQFLRPLQAALAGTALVAVLAATLLSYAVARTVTRPLDAITSTMREITATGDLTRRIEPKRAWMDEDTRLLASTFNGLTESIARFQREATQRERLSALGRLSTVIAHEIRNPLMIIKTSLRTLKREGATAQQIHRTAGSIDEEVSRLNRIVSEVLDFARPIRFEYGEDDVNRLCADAAAAASATDDERAGIHLQLAAQPAAIVTDGERLRLALVNVLANACQAVMTTEGMEHGRPVELATSSLDADRVAIVVRDHGSGIRAEDLPRVFDLYFTTKRTGSGLGLAIARNIVEGLGGTIAATSRLNDGTEIRIELPRRPAAADSSRGEATVAGRATVPIATQTS